MTNYAHWEKILTGWKKELDKRYIICYIKNVLFNVEVKMRQLLLPFIIFTALSCSISFADTINVSGPVSGTWSADTVLVIGEVRVPPGETLAIMPGVEVLFEVYCKFIVDSMATLIAVGDRG